MLPYVAVFVVSFTGNQIFLLELNADSEYRATNVSGKHNKVFEVKDLKKRFRNLPT